MRPSRHRASSRGVRRSEVPDVGFLLASAVVCGRAASISPVEVSVCLCRTGDHSEGTRQKSHGPGLLLLSLGGAGDCALLELLPLVLVAETCFVHRPVQSCPVPYAQVSLGLSSVKGARACLT